MQNDNKNNLGALYLNDKRNNDKAPDYRGSLITTDKKFSISSWRDFKGSNYTNAGRGVLFLNANKSSDKHPDMIGSITVPSGVRYFVSAWHRESLAGNKYLRLAVKEWANQFDEIGAEPFSVASQDWKEK